MTTTNAEQEARFAKMEERTNRTIEALRALAAGTITLEEIKKDEVLDWENNQDKQMFTTMATAIQRGQKHLVELIILEAETDFNTLRLWGEGELMNWVKRCGDKTAVDLLERLQRATTQGYDIYQATHYGGPEILPGSYKRLVSIYKQLQEAHNKFKEAHPEPQKQRKPAKPKSLTLPQRNAVRYLADALVLMRDLGANEILQNSGEGGIDLGDLTPEQQAALEEYRAMVTRATE